MRKEIDPELLLKVSEDAGLPLKDVSEAELRDLHLLQKGLMPTSIISGEAREAWGEQNRLTDKYSGGNRKNAGSGLGRRHIQLEQNLEAIFDEEPRNLSYGVFAPTYMEMMHGHLKWVPEPRILLAGALTGFTVEEFDRTVRKLYPQARTMVLDIESAVSGQAAERLGIPFVEADILNPKFTAGTFDEVHANALFDQLFGKADLLGNLKQALQEISRILTPGGTFYSVERVPYEFYHSNSSWEDDPKAQEKYIDIITRFAKAAGFSSIEIRSSLSFSTRGKIRAFLQGDSQMIAQASDLKPSAMLAICLQK